MDQTQLLAHCGSNKITREELRMVPTPEGTESHHPLAHPLIVDALAETLAFRHISVVRDEYAVSQDGMKMFGVLDLETAFEGCRFSIGIRNSNDKSRSEEHTSELQSHSDLVCRLLLEKKKDIRQCGRTG